MKRYNTTAKPWAKQPKPVPELETAEPSRPASFTSDLLVPLGQAVTTGALVGGLVLFGLGELAPDWDGDLVKVFGGVALAVTALAWLVLLGQTRRLLWSIERLTGLDINQDGAKGKPRDRLLLLNAMRAQAAAERQEAAQRQSDFAQFVTGIPVKGTALREWEGKLGRETYTEYRDALIRLGLARWISIKADGSPNERQGWELTTEPAEILKRIG